MMGDYVLQMKEVSKSFGGVHALKEVDLNLRKGEVLCLVGENGAGKSTLMKILSGVLTPDKGEIILKGEKMPIRNPAEAYRAGISIVHQELIQIPSMSVAENIYLGRYDTKGGFISFRKLVERTEELMEKLDIYFDPESRLSTYSVAQRQLIEILKALSYDASIIIFDEPTAALTTDESELLYKIIRRLKKEGLSVIFISHRMDDIFAVGDRLLCLKDGEVSGEADVKEITVPEIIRMMVGREFSREQKKEREQTKEVIFSVQNLTNKKLQDISFDLNKGEVPGIGGLIDAGRTEVLRAVFGIDPCGGTMFFEGKPICNKSPRDAIANGFSFVPEDRKDQGLILMADILSNVELNILKKVSCGGFMIRQKETGMVNSFVEKLEIKARNIFTRVGMLSGGNQQKVVIAKSLSSEPRIVLLDEPTRGVDVGAKAEIYSIIETLVANGVSVIMVSSELPELISISDRIMVMREGRMTGIMDAKEATEEKIMEMAVN